MIDASVLRDMPANTVYSLDTTGMPESSQTASIDVVYVNRGDSEDGDERREFMSVDPKFGVFFVYLNRISLK